MDRISMSMMKGDWRLGWERTSVLMFNVCVIFAIYIMEGCNKKDAEAEPVAPPATRLNVVTATIDVGTGGTTSGGGLAQTLSGATAYNVAYNPSIKIAYSAPLNPATVPAAVSLKDQQGNEISINRTLANGDSAIVVAMVQPLSALQQYTLEIKSVLRSKFGALPDSTTRYRLVTAIDSSNKFSLVSDDQLLTIIQRQTFKYFWDFAHPVSGMIRDRNQNPDIVTTGGTGMGLMAIIVGIHRGFITHAEGLTRIAKIVDFLKTKTNTYHGAFPHFINGASGATIPFSTKDNGADLVETSLLMQGMLTARQYFSNADVTETKLSEDITALFNKVEWSWFRKDDGNVLYWHWSPQYNWEMNLPIRGWNEALITYVLAAAPGNFRISKSVYDEGWAANGGIRNGQQYAGLKLPLGPAFGGPLFFSHYSFLGLDPHSLKDQYANYWEQVVNHTRIHELYAEQNPRKYNGYSASVWGLTASDNNVSGYAAHSPVNDLGVVAPTAAVSSLPYTPEESMRAIRFYYYKLGDRLFKEYGFVDAFNLSDLWFASSFLAIDQGPQIVMIENQRSGLIWKLFMSCPEVQAGLTRLGFSF